MVNDTYDLIIRESQNKDEKLAIIRVHLIQCKSKTRRKILAGADWLIDYGLVLMSDHTYYCLGILWYDLLFLSGDLFRFVRGPQAENSTLKVKKVGYYPTIDNANFNFSVSHINLWTIHNSLHGKN